MKAFRILSLVVLLLPAGSCPQESSAGDRSIQAASPEMARLAKALLGDWDTTEEMVRGQFFPDGGARTGHVRARLASGGYTLIYDVHSDGSAGTFDGFLAIWWDRKAQLYYFLACFNNPNSPCRMRGTGHWDGGSFVNDYDFTVNGKKTPWRDTFTFTPDSYTLIAAVDTGDGTMKPVITTNATRSSKAALPPRGEGTPQTDKLSAEERLLMASRIYSIVTIYFPHLSQAAFDAQYGEYLSRVLKTEERRDFDLASMEFAATLHDGHTWFYDDWLDKKYGQPVGFIAYPIDGYWTVIRSAIENVKVGDVITKIDGSPVDQVFAANRKYISASSDRDAGVSFFDTPAIFPERFTLTLDDGRQAVVDRVNDKKKEEGNPKTEGRWLTPGAVAYIKVPTFHGIETQAQALQYFREFHSAQAIILDVRGNPGLGAASALQIALMTKPYTSWINSSSARGGALLRNADVAHPERSEITTTDTVISPRDPVYSGRLFLLVDRGCTCACEDFVMPFKFAKRAILVGETTAGTFAFTTFNRFDNGMMLNVTAIRRTFPDGSRFEGVGISPDVEVHPTARDLKEGRDVVLSRAIEMAGAR